MSRQLMKTQSCLRNTQMSSEQLQRLTRIFQRYVLENQWIPKRPHPETKKSGPSSKQALFLMLLEVLEAFYGGAAGGGKSDCLLMAALMFVDVPGYSAIIFRRSYTDLTKSGALIARSFEWLSGTKARWDAVNHTWNFPSGAKLAFGFLENDFDVYHHQSAEYHFIGFDELTQFTEFQYTFMISRARRLEGSFVPIRIRIRSASNPPGLVRGRVFGEWVKARFLPWFTLSLIHISEPTRRTPISYA